MTKRAPVLADFKRIVVKVGSSLIVDPNKASANALG